MPDLRTYALLTTGVVVSWATYLSVKNNSYLDTSNPLLTALPHPLHATHYFASKKNILNVIFIKKAWGWTTAAFFTLFFLSTPKTIAPSSSGNTSWTFRRLLQYALATACWLFFSSWFFGPPVLDRLIAASGGECVLHLPGPHGAYIPIPAQYCTERIRISPSTHPELFPSPLLSAADLLSKSGAHAEWTGIPRLRRGHDVSGHIFLLTLSICFLADQLRQTWQAKGNGKRGEWWAVGVLVNVGMIGLWLFASWVTSVYFHSPFEKVTGYRACLSLIY